MKINLIKYFLILTLVVVNYSCEKPEIRSFESGLELSSIGEIINQNLEEYSDFAKLVETVGLEDALLSYNPYGNDFTLFLPTNAAFDRFFNGSSVYNNMNELLSDLTFSNELAKYHILNAGIRSNDFPFGAFVDTTLSGDLLSVGFVTGLDSVLFLINNFAPIVKRDIEARNGYIHVLEEVLAPVVFSSYEWLKANPDFSILSDVFEITNVKDLMGLTIENSAGDFIVNKYTLLAEPDSIYHKDGIYSVQDLIQKLNSDQDDYTSETNPLYQFATYHLLEDVYFLDGFQGNRNYNTFSESPIRIAADARVKINDAPLFHVFDTIIRDTDTLYINYLEPLYDVSNIISKNGAIHLLNHVLFPYRPRLSAVSFGFLNDPYINELSRNDGTYILNERSPLTMISWEGTDEFTYHKTSSTAERADNGDYLRIEGDFIITYQLPRIYPGAYNVTLNANSVFQRNAIIEVFVDGKKIGGNVNLTTGASTADVYREAFLGTVDFSDYVTHSITVKSVLPGRFTWDYIKFSPL